MSGQTYDIAIIGGGPGGHYAARFGARLGARVAMLNLPAQNDTSGYFLGAHYIDALPGRVSLRAHGRIKVGDKIITAKKIVIASKAKPYVPSILGLKKVPYHTLDTIDTFKRRPKQLVVIGAGPNGVAQALEFAKRGSQVALVEHNSRILASADADARTLVEKQLRAVGVELYTSASVPKVTKIEHAIKVHISQFTTGSDIRATALLVATGWQPNFPTGLKAAEIYKNPHQVIVNETWQTTNRNVYAIGSCAGQLDDDLRTAEEAIMHALGNHVRPRPANIRPTISATQPTIAQVGPTEAWCQLEGLSYEVYHLDFSDIDLNQTAGFIKILVDLQGYIISATIVGQSAGELIGYMAEAIEQGQKLSALHSLLVPNGVIAGGLRQLGLEAYFDDLERPSLPLRLLRYMRAKI